MSANIPANMQLTDILKSTGFNCPEELKGSSMVEAISKPTFQISTQFNPNINNYFLFPYENEQALDVSIISYPIIDPTEDSELNSNELGYSRGELDMRSFKVSEGTKVFADAFGNEFTMSYSDDEGLVTFTVTKVLNASVNTEVIIQGSEGQE